MSIRAANLPEIDLTDPTGPFLVSKKNDPRLAAARAREEREAEEAANVSPVEAMFHLLLKGMSKVPARAMELRFACRTRDRALFDRLLAVVSRAPNVAPAIRLFIARNGDGLFEEGRRFFAD